MQIAGVVDHAGVEGLQFRDDAPLVHRAGQVLDHVRGVDAGDPVEIERAEGQTGHVGLDVAVELEDLGALLEAREVAPAQRDADDQVRREGPNAGNEALVDPGLVGGLARGLVPRVQVDHGDADLDGPVYVLDDLGDRDRDVGRHRFRRDHARRGEIHDQVHAAFLFIKLRGER